MSKHTKGPWSISPTSNPETEFGIASNDGTIIARLDSWFDKDEPEADANARLIASAPDLLEALEALLRLYATECDGLYSGEGAWGEAQAARAAIARAKGQSV
jgi:hypothetical protein